MMSRVGQDFKARLVLYDLDAETVNLDLGIYLRDELIRVPLTGSQLSALIK